MWGQKEYKITFLIVVISFGALCTNAKTLKSVMYSLGKNIPSLAVQNCSNMGKVHFH